MPVSEASARVIRATGIVLVAGLGDLGIRVANSLARRGAVGRLVLAGRRPEAGRAHAGQLRVIAALSGGPPIVDFEQVDLEDQAQTVDLLQRVQPDVLVLVASRATWWRPLAADPARARQLAELPYGAWLPIHVSLVRRVMEARRQAKVTTQVVSLPFPDAVGPALAPLGLAPDSGAGNVAEVASKLQVLAASEFAIEPGDVTVRLVMHHASERIAFDAFRELSGGHRDAAEAPWIGQVTVRGERLPDRWVDQAIHAAYSLPPGVASQEMTAAATVQVVTALLSTQPELIHVPAPGGLPGGYPVTASRTGIELNLPAGITCEETIAINTCAARWDGIDTFEPDGTIVFTAAMTEITERVLGLRLDRLPPGDVDAMAAEMLQRAAS